MSTVTFGYKVMNQNYFFGSTATVKDKNLLPTIKDNKAILLL